jgi:hypothetical protein
MVYIIIEDSKNPKKNKLYPNNVHFKGKVSDPETRAAKALIHDDLDTVQFI